MDEVDGMSAGDRGGVADLIASIKVSKIPIICICNDRYSQKLKSLVNYCLLLSFRKPTKQQVSLCHNVSFLSSFNLFLSGDLCSFSFILCHNISTMSDNVQLMIQVWFSCMLSSGFLSVVIIRRF